MSRRARLKPQSPQLARHRPRRHSPCPPCLRGEYSCETKPIPRLRIADWGLRIGNGPAAGRPLQPAASGLHGPVVQTNPIGRSESCKTNPISSGGTRPRRVGHGAIVRNEPNSPRSRVGRSTRGVGRGGKRAKRSQFPAKRPPQERSIVRNEANLPQAIGKGRGRPGPGGPTEDNCAKRTQFPAAPGGTRLQGVGRGVNRAKQTQFGGVRGTKCAKRTQFGRCGRREPPLFQYSIIPAFQSDAHCAKRTQFPAITGGTGPQRPGTQDKCAKRSQFASHQWNEAAVTKAASIAAGHKHAKQTQFPGVEPKQWMGNPPRYSGRTQSVPRRPAAVDKAGGRPYDSSY
jgi:hypothetical protein